MFRLADRIMPRKCCVPGCDSNYVGRELKSVFRFPSDNEGRKNWVRSIHRDNFEPNKNSVVCEDHFLETDIIREDVIKKPDGSILTCTRKIPKLKDGSFPSIFKNQPSYMSRVLPKKRKTPEERHMQIETLKKQKEAKIIELERINSFCDLSNNIESFYDKTLDYIVIKNENSVTFCKITIPFEGSPKINLSVCINPFLQINVYLKDVNITNNIFSLLNRSDDFSCNSWTVLNDVLRSSCKFISMPPQQTESDEFQYKSYLKAAQLSLKACHSIITNDNVIRPKIQFLEEQIELILMESIRYTSRMLVWACVLCFNNPSGYIALRNSNVLTLPNKRYLDTFKMKLGCDNSGLSKQQSAYLKKKKQCLESNELYVNLLIDEVYVRPDVSYKAGKIEGMVVQNNELKAAETVQTFMISSIMSNYKDVVGLFPQTHICAEDLYHLIMDILQLLTSIGFRIVAIISDNNRVNRKMFELLCAGSIKQSVQNPFNKEETIFLLFDSVHLFKSIRNNWLNQRDCQQTLRFPEPEVLLNQINRTEYDPVAIVYPQNCMEAKLSDLKTVYRMEQNKVVKLAPSLSQKVLYPSSIERQNVTLCTKLFDEKVVGALQTLSGDTTGTCEFIKVILTWWNIVNTKSTLTGIKLRNKFREPVKSEDDEAMQFLNNFVQWLDEWSSFENTGKNQKQGSYCGKLSRETEFSLKHTTIAMIGMSKYLLNTNILQYILLGKFQNDEIESRFGQYRQMSGGNYHINVTELLESEKKLKTISLLKLKSSKAGEFSLKDLVLEESDCEIDLHEYDELSDSININNVLEEVKHYDVSENEQMSLIYIAGYAAKKIITSHNCLACRDIILYDEEFAFEDTLMRDAGRYLSILSRGGLKKPKPEIVCIFVEVLKLFKLIIELHEESFLKQKSQRKSLYSYSLEMLQECCNLCLTSCVDCQIPHLVLVKKCVSIFCNILLNNYSKNIKDRLHSLKNDKRKVKKLSS